MRSLGTFALAEPGYFEEGAEGAGLDVGEPEKTRDSHLSSKATERGRLIRGHGRQLSVPLSLSLGQGKGREGMAQEERRFVFPCGFG